MFRVKSPVFSCVKGGSEAWQTVAMRIWCAGTRKRCFFSAKNGQGSFYRKRFDAGDIPCGVEILETLQFSLTESVVAVHCRK